jgi:hypothetical protein
MQSGVWPNVIMDWSPMSLSVRGLSLQIERKHLVLAIAFIFMNGCTSQKVVPRASVEMTRVPTASPGGPEQMDAIEGRVTSAKPGQQVVLYAKNGIWFIQPFANEPFTPIQSDATWKGFTHFGTEYAALLVDPGYHAQPKMTTLPSEGNGVAAVLTVKGSASPSAAIKTIHFSGYDWIVRSAPSERGGEMNNYDTANAWTDEKGYLHLKMGQSDGRWTCAEVSLTRSLGYGTYKFVVQDSAHLSASSVVGIFTLDENLPEDNRPEMDIELSQWGRLGSKNAQYVIQPYYIPQNIVRFSVGPGVNTHVLRWEPGSASFKTVPGSVAAPGVKGISEHVFRSGIPTAAGETIHIDLYDFFHSKSTSQRPAEVVIEKFEYLP